MSRGVTLIEMMVALTVLGLATAVAGLALVGLRPVPDAGPVSALIATRDEAIRSGRPLIWGQDTVAVRFLPDGSSSGGRIALENGTVVVDPLTGRVHGSR